jgi:hypothetical protein
MPFDYQIPRGSLAGFPQEPDRAGTGTPTRNVRATQTVEASTMHLRHTYAY